MFILTLANSSHSVSLWDIIYISYCHRVFKALASSRLRLRLVGWWRTLWFGALVVVPATVEKTYLLIALIKFILDQSFRSYSRLFPWMGRVGVFASLS